MTTEEMVAHPKARYSILGLYMAIGFMGGTVVQWLLATFFTGPWVIPVGSAMVTAILLVRVGEWVQMDVDDAPR